MAVTFDAANLVITLESLVTTVEASDIYSDWKDWVASGAGAGVVPAFRVVGGDPVTVTQNAGSYFFLRNDLGWRIRPPEEDILIIVNGNLVLENSATAWRIPTIGNFNTGIDRNFSSLTIETVTAGGSGLDAGQDAKLTRVHELLDVIEGTFSHAEVMRLLLSVAAGKLSGADGTSVAIRDQADSKNRVVATVDEFGNRTAVAVDAS